jgi:hypothetical protein
VAATSNDHQEWVVLITLAEQDQPAIQPAAILRIITKDTLLQVQAEQLVIFLDTEGQMADLG